MHIMSFKNFQEGVRLKYTEKKLNPLSFVCFIFNLKVQRSWELEMRLKVVYILVFYLWSSITCRENTIDPIISYMYSCIGAYDYHNILGWFSGKEVS